MNEQLSTKESSIITKPKKVGNYNDMRVKIKNAQESEIEVIIPRTYHLNPEKKQKIESESEALGRPYPNPLVNRTGPYWGAVESLISLGFNEWYSIKTVCKKMEEILLDIPKKITDTVTGEIINTNVWDIFSNKESRVSASNPKDILGRIIQNFKVLQRLPRVGKKEKHPYGLKLAQFGMCIDIKEKEVHEGIKVIFIRINNTWDEDEFGINITPVKISSKRGRVKKPV